MRQSVICNPQSGVLYCLRCALVNSPQRQRVTEKIRQNCSGSEVRFNDSSGFSPPFPESDGQRGSGADKIKIE
jgi:hypothetical protein